MGQPSEDIVATTADAKQLLGHVIDTRGAPRMHGYDLHCDLVVNYSFAEVLLTALLGEAPDPHAGHAFAVALGFLTPVGAGEAPAHAAILGTMVGAPPGSTQAIAAVTLSNQGASIAERWHSFFAAFDDDRPTPMPFVATAEDRAGIDRLCVALGGRVPPALMREDLPLEGALVAVLYACGLTDAWQIACAITTARLPIVCAEAQRHGRHDMRDYPINLPKYVYEEDDRE